MEMLKTEVNQSDEDDDDDVEFSSRSGDGSSQKVVVEVEGKRSDRRKTNVLRSKHSEAEQRRRSKINERFQILRNLIPENDHKRDKASLLLEAIQYIQLLQEKIKIYEGPYQNWNAEPSKFIAWRNSSRAAENSELIRNDSAQEDSVVDPAMLANAHESVESDSSAEALYKTMDDLQRLTNKAIPFDMHMQPGLFEASSVQPSQESSPFEQLASQSQLWYWPDKQNEQEGAKTGGRESGVSNEYSQRLKNTLNQTLASLGVDMLQANVAVQLDISQHSTTCDHAHKKLRKEQC